MAWSQGRAGAARPLLRRRRRGGLHPHRRGPHAADHLRSGRAVGPLVRRVRPGGQPAAARARRARTTTRSTWPSGPWRSPSAASAGSRTGSASTTCTSRSTPRWSATSTTRCRAKELYKRDKDYIVNDGEVLIVDEFTGRILYGRRYNEGMHQAIEAKEGVEIKQENQTLATITLQNYFRLYEKLSGMTGTAQTEAGEFQKVYKVGVVPIPTHRPMVRGGQVRRHLQDARRRSSTPSSRTSSSGTRRASRCWSARSAWRTPRSCRRCCAARASRTRC